MRAKKFIYIIVAIIILLLGLIFTISIASSFLWNLWKEKNIEVRTTARTNQPLELEGFARVKGTKYLLAEITAEKTETYIGSSVPGIRGEVRNLVFLDGDTLSSHRLFETNTMVILDRYQYPKSQIQTDGYYPPPPDDTVTRWLVYHIVKEDTNKDGEQNYKDLCTIAVSDVSGIDYVELLHDINWFSGMTMIEEGQLIVVYNKAGVTQASILDLENREVINTKEIVAIGEGKE